MDLGLNALTDDQLLELLQQACVELGERQPFVRALAQQNIFDQADLVEARKNGLEKAIRQVRSEYIAKIEADVLAQVKEGVEKGEIRLCDPEQEAGAIVHSSLDAVVKLIDEAIRKLETEPADFCCEIRGAELTLLFGEQRVEHQLRGRAVKELLHNLKCCLAPAMMPQPEPPTYPEVNPNRRFGKFGV